MSSFNPTDKKKRPQSRVVTESIGARISGDLDGRVREEFSGLLAASVSSIRLVGVDLSVRLRPSSVPRASTVMHSPPSVKFHWLITV
jgi:hypothetical protein